MSIHLLLGPMYSGKSSELIRRLNRFKIGGKSTFLIKYKNDNRYNTTNNKLSTHDEFKVDCNYSSDGKLMDDKTLNAKLTNIQVICIDEGQFYFDIDTFAEHHANLGKIVIIAALDGDFRRKPFGKILNLIPLAEEFVKLTAVCSCGNEAAFSKRITPETDEILIGGTDKYVAQCRSCYNNTTK
jgi:thymidine kinase